MALTELNTVLETVQHTLANIDTIGGQVHLERVQEGWNTLNNLVKEQCSQANANISHYNNNNRRFHYTLEYHYRYYESWNYYASESFRSVEGVLHQLKLRMIDLEKCGCVTNDSYIFEEDELRLKYKLTDSKDEYKQAFRRWRGTYELRRPLP